MRSLGRLAGWALVVAMTIYLGWAIPAITGHRWGLLALATACVLVALRGNVLAVVPGLVVAVYVGEPALIVAFGLMLAFRILPRAMPLWAMRSRTTPALLAAAASGLDAGVAGILARIAGDGPISTSTLLRAAAVERPDIWHGRYDPAAADTYDGYLLRDTSGRGWTSLAAETVILAQMIAAEATDASPVQVLGSAALIVPESGARRRMRSRADTAEALTRTTGLGIDHLVEIGSKFAIGPAGADATRRAAVRVKIDPAETVPAEELFALSNGRLWLLSIGLRLVGSPAAARPAAPHSSTPAPAPKPPIPAPAPTRPAYQIPASSRPALRWRYREWLRAAAADTSWPATLALRLLRPALTVTAIVSIAIAHLPWWGRVAGALVLVVVRPVRRWWLDFVFVLALVGPPLADPSLAAGPALWVGAAALALRLAVTGVVVLRWGVEQAVALPRRRLPAAATGRSSDTLSAPDVARTEYLRAIDADDDTLGESLEFLTGMWAAVDGFRLVTALIEVARLELIGRAPSVPARPQILRNMRAMAILETFVSVVPRYVVAAVAAATAFLFASDGALRLGPVHVPGPWLDAATAGLLAVMTVRPKPWLRVAVAIAAVELWRVGSHFLVTVAVLLVGALAAQGLRDATTRRGLNSPVRLAWVGRRVTGLRHRRRFQAAAALAAQGRPGIAVDILDDIVVRCRGHQRSLTAVAWAQHALVELDRGRLQQAVERATAAHEVATSRVVPTAHAIAEFAYGTVQFEVGSYSEARTALTAAERRLRRRPEGRACVSMLARTLAVTNDVDGALATASRAARGITSAGQMLALVEAQIAAGWALVHARRIDEARQTMSGFASMSSDTIDSDLVDDRTRRTWWRLLGHAQLLMGRIELADGHAGAAADQLRQAAQQLRRTNAADLLGITRIYEGQCHRARDEWAQGREAVRAGLDLLEQRRGQLRLGAHRSDAIVAGRDHYDAAFDVLTAADRHGDPQAGLVAAGLMESLRRSALAGMLRGGRSAFADGLSDAARATIDEIARLEGALNIAGPADGTPPADEQAAQRLEDLAERLDRARAQLDLEVSRGFAEAYLPHAVDPQPMLAAAGDAHVLQFEFVATGPDGWRGYRVWTPPYGQPRVEAVAVTDPAALELLRATHGDHHPGDKPFARALVAIADACAALAAALLPAELVAALRAARGDDPVRLLVVPGEHLAYLPWAALLLDPEDEESVLLHKAVIQLVPSLSLLSGQGGAPDGGRPMLAYLDREAAINVEGPGPNAESWRRLAKALAVTRVGSRPEFEDRLASDPPAGVYVMAHGVDGAGLSQGILFNDGGVLSAATALGLRWPRWMMFASCFAAKVEQRPGVEPLGLAVACMLGGCRTFVGGVIAVERVATGDIAADVSIALAAGIDPAVALRDAQRAFFAAWGAAALVDQWAGLICISTEWTQTARNTDPRR